MKTPLLAALTVLVPTLAVAQAPDPNDPNAPPVVVEPAPTTPPPPVPVPAAEKPVIIVNPPAQTTTYTTTTPEYETYVSPWNAPVFTGGAAVFLGAYGGSLIVAGLSEDDQVYRGNDKLYYPVAGPWLALIERPDCVGDCEYEDVKKGLLVADGILQAGGVMAMVAGLLSPTEYRVVRRPSYVSKKVTVSPSAGGNPGVSLFGRW